MVKLNKSKFLELFDQNTPYIAVKMDKEDHIDPEIIIIMNSNFSKMKKFYDETYEETPEGLKNKYSKIKILITDATILRDLKYLELFLRLKRYI